jgi:hypothetical protein
MATIRVQGSHSRNAYDWSYEVDSTGRHILNANRKGMKQRIGKVFAHLNKQGGKLRAGQILIFLQKLHPSFAENDLSQLRNQMTKHGVIATRGRGADAVWSITSKGRAIMANVTYEWV